MPRSEIDDIFAASNASVSTPAPSTPLVPEKKKKKTKKRKRDDEEKSAAPSETAAQPQSKRKVPETVLDPSVYPTPAQARSTKPQKSQRPDIKKKSRGDREDEERFKDSRGTGPRRKTEEGFLVYKEDELGITDQGGDTPLCPFDCECCK
ncbi:hypothetical protein PHLGIDRAFT_61567 [Phlebiopsis gigantea 11061_1 CR5-6]|uniref:DUF1764-domain-containing protein n=1 Tax=Phlebiopsis gigantea (strain 11061_1 CR5-6) TaxID=745531 RepID=A0A0C3SEB2_PHLG1|nr:hypothetical protein PHLGIDRAFT_61567 [Phlebiopsis gigantea 11061_1 CR5-6]